MDSRFVRATIRHLLTVIFLGICMMWIMAPTNTYLQKWRPSIHKKLVSTYFGTQAPSMLIWTFPVLFVASLGSLYLHLGKNSNQDASQSNEKKHRRALWRKPVLVKGPLGIVSGIELALLIMFIALLVWSLVTYLRRLHTITPKAAAKEGVKMGNEVIRCSVVDRAYGECVFSISVLPSGSWLIGAAAVRSNLGGQHQVPYMAWTHDHGSFHNSRHLLYH
ncbi:hypothetical protein Gorai_018406 [Gossypium raimondii]|uniref:Ferric oxidoreductase domain-containing protein n=1 Tax=Gossypium raimondii TaxID=29730 RepID=A0A7J8PKY5_GOSRA|nr:hypothetical protein [Gossypium raimondii]